MIYRTPFVDHTLRLNQLNWVVLAYNCNIEFGPKNLESKCRCNSSYHFTTTLLCYYTLHYHFIPAVAEYQP
jgi:hypothetical protein